MLVKSLAVNGTNALAHQLDVPVRKIRRRGTLGKASQSFTILQEGGHGVGHGCQIVRGCNHTVDTRAEHFAKTWQIASDAGFAAGEILHDHAGQSLPHGTEQAEIRECDQPLGVVPITGKDHLSLEPKPLGPRFDGRAKRPVAREHKHRVGQPDGDFVESVQKFRVSLAWLECRDHQEYRRARRGRRQAQQIAPIVGRTGVAKTIEIESGTDDMMFVWMSHSCAQAQVTDALAHADERTGDWRCQPFQGEIGKPLGDADIDKRHDMHAMNDRWNSRPPCCATPENACLAGVRMHDVGIQRAEFLGKRQQCPHVGDRRNGPSQARDANEFHPRVHFSYDFRLDRLAM
ncbi:hypothetical protein NKH11_23625 [Mesorhizobium sp. M1393]